jgi:DNA-binding NtrC family response regulator
LIRAHAKPGKSTFATNGNEAPRSQSKIKSVKATNDRDGSREAFQERVESLCSQAAALTGEIQDLKWFDLRGEPLSFEDGIDFYKEVRRFEAMMIVQALKRAGGSQTKAAVLLRMNDTTLNSKIKRYRLTGEIIRGVSGTQRWSCNLT